MVCLGFKPMGCRMVGADETMELWRLPFLGEILSKHSQSDIHRSLEDSGSCLVIVHYNREKVALITFCLSESFQFGMPNISPSGYSLSLSLLEVVQAAPELIKNNKNKLSRLKCFFKYGPIPAIFSFIFVLFLFQWQFQKYKLKTV